MKNVPALKADMAKRMSGPKYVEEPLGRRSTHEKTMKGMVQGYKHGKEGKNLTYRKDKKFTKDSSNGAVRKVRGVSGGYEITE